MAAAIFIGTYMKVRLLTPFQHMMKSDIVAYGETLEVPWIRTWSCYKGGQLHCGTCPTCLSRKGAFSAAGVEDPTLYQDEAD